MLKKLKKNNGETLIEALVALLIAVVSMSLVASASLAVAKLNEKNRKADKEFAEELEQAELYLSDEVLNKTITIEFTKGDPVEKTVRVYGDGSRFASYRQ